MLAIGLVSLFYGVVEIVLSFEVKSLPQHFDEINQKLDDVAGRSRPMASTGA